MRTLHGLVWVLLLCMVALKGCGWRRWSRLGAEPARRDPCRGARRHHHQRHHGEQRANRWERKTRFLPLLRGDGRLTGRALALLGVTLLFAAAILPGWLAIAGAVYVAGWLATRPRPAPQREDSAPPREADENAPDDTMHRLDRLIARARLHLPEDLAVHLYSLRSSVAEVLPRLLQARAHDADLYTVRETVRRYLPDTLAAYLALPPAFRDRHPVQDGKTARDLLAEQLALLDEKMREIVANVATRDAQALLANGRFLEMKFPPAPDVPSR